MTTDVPRVSPDWLSLREAADAAARAADLADRVRAALGGGRLVIHDLGTGTGSMGRWLAARLPGPQHWIMYDRDADLLAHAAAGMTGTAADGAPVTVETRERDITRLTAADLADASLVTASALLDMLTEDEIERVVAACAGTRRPALLTLSVTGGAELQPPDPLDAQVTAAFNDHQRRTTGGRTLLGPEAAAATTAAFRRHGATVTVRPAPWRLGPAEAALTSEWFDGWFGAACEQRPELTSAAAGYATRRAAEATDGRLAVVVHHDDLLAEWR